MASTASLMGLGLPGQLADALGDNQVLPATTTFTTLIGSGSGTLIKNSASTGRVTIQGGSGAGVDSAGSWLRLNGSGAAEPGGVELDTGTTAGSRMLLGLGSSASYAKVSDNTGTEVLRIGISGKLTLSATNTAGGTTGNQTINKPSGSVNMAAGASTLTVTNSLVATTSVVLAVVQTADATALLKNVVPGSGSFVINLNANATAETKIGFVVFN